MGGYGSTRWQSHWRKTQVEESLGLSLKTIKDGVRYVEQHRWPYGGTVCWNVGDQWRGEISYRVESYGEALSVRLMYKLTPKGGKAQDFDYLVRLNSTRLPWGGVRWWFICPLLKQGQPCNRRVAKLFLPPGAHYFGCRVCHNLAYRSNQEEHERDSFYEMMAVILRADYPGITYRQIKRWADGEDEVIPASIVARLLEEYMNRDRYPGYLTAEELCRASGLAREDLVRLEVARLLLPDSQDGRYRPKLKGWAGKLAFLLGQGWEMEEIKRWSKGRWKSANPRAWPPARDHWRDG
jgi:hypothetical protein